MTAAVPVLIVGAHPVIVSEDPLESLTDKERASLSKLVRVKVAGDKWSITRSGRYAGLVRTTSLALWIEPPFSTAAFLYLLLRRSGLPELADSAYKLASTGHDRGHRSIMTVLALLMGREAEKLAAAHIAQAYAQRTQRLGVVRGRPLWHRQGGRPKDGTVLTRFDEKTTDVLENRLVLAGIAGAQRWLSGGVQLRTQEFVWRSLAEPVVPAKHDFDIAMSRLNRLTEAYGPVLSLAQALLFGLNFEPDRADVGINSPTFDLALLFETLVEDIAALAYKRHGLQVTRQTSEGQALVDGLGRTYRSIRPDLVVYNGEVPKRVIDSKFKPVYATGGEKPSGKHRLSREDIFQTFFYATRLAQRHNQSRPLPAAIAAPLLDGGQAPHEAFRTVRWGEDNVDTARLDLLLVPVDDGVRALRRSDHEWCDQVVRPKLATNQITN
ncbi:hypothetical protein [Microbacterium sp. NPDC089188]|uniref:5-methylcytosine restriction system specificity protein McrC n=1 Tax=Microbacterium sp. NPDC089188 TaxID=3154971 RepID=UPI00341D1919